MTTIDKPNDGRKMMDKLFGPLGRWLVSGLMVVILIFGGLVWNDLKTEIEKLTDPDKGIRAQIHELDKKLVEVATTQKRILTDVAETKKKLDRHLIEGNKL